MDRTALRVGPYEFWYNWDYVIQDNPALMCFGRTGGYGETRRLMRERVEAGDRVGAERCFWILVAESESEMVYDADEIGCTVEDLLLRWFQDALYDPKARELEMFREAAHFMRRRDVPYAEAMRDTPLDLYPNSMIIPTMNMDTWLGIAEHEHYAQELRDHIEWMLSPSNDFVDPMAAEAIY